MTGVRELTIRGRLDTAFEAVDAGNGRVEVSVDCLGTDIAFDLPSFDAAKQAGLAWIHAVEKAERQAAVAAYAGRAAS